MRKFVIKAFINGKGIARNENIFWVATIMNSYCSEQIVFHNDNDCDF